MDRIYFWPIGFLIFFAIYILVMFFFIRKKKSKYLIICFSVFYFYLMYVIALTLFPLPLPNFGINPDGNVIWRFGINLKPFYFGRSIQYRLIVFEIVANVLMTIPFGFGINFISKILIKSLLWLPFAVGFVIELLQLVLSLFVGFFYRAVDINDVITNALGVYIGYLIFRILVFILGKMKLKKLGFLEYILNAGKVEKN